MTIDKLLELENDYKKAKKNGIIAIPVCIVGVLLSVLLLAVGLVPVSVVLFIGLIIYAVVVENTKKKKATIAHNALGESILETLGLSALKFTEPYDDRIFVKSSKAVDTYDDLKYIKEYDKAEYIISVGRSKREYQKLISDFLKNNDYKDYSFYSMYENRLSGNLDNTHGYNILVCYSSPTGKSNKSRVIHISQKRIKEIESDKSLTMTKSEYNKYLKEQAKAELEGKQHDYYERVNSIIDYANDTQEALIVKSDEEELDKLIASLFDRTINSIKKIKTIDSEEWDILDKFIDTIEGGVNSIADKNKRIHDYYESDDFAKIKNTCDSLMTSQREFNEYIDEKVKSISALFGTNVVRNETVNEDEFNYIHPYKKSITPFTAEVSATVFSSAENSPMEYIVKYFYPNKASYPEQIQKLHLLVEELETLKEAKVIIDTYKSDVQQYITEVPPFIMECDEDGFYSRLGFAIINENTLTVAYKFSYTSNGGKAQRYFTVPMTEETIVELIQMLESKLTMSAFKKEQRMLMTGKLRQAIKERDDFTCKMCGNSIHSEPNLLLEIDHIIPVSKGGVTEESNLQTLCWKCNRSKGAKLV